LANLIIDMPDDLARSLEGIAAAQHISVEQLAVERLRSLVETGVDSGGNRSRSPKGDATIAAPERLGCSRTRGSHSKGPNASPDERSVFGMQLS
jgi:hypothetical protein